MRLFLVVRQYNLHLLGLFLVMLPLFDTQVLLDLMHGLKLRISKGRTQVLLHPVSVWCIHGTGNSISDGVRHGRRRALWPNGGVAATSSWVNRYTLLRLSLTFLLHQSIWCCCNSLMWILPQIIRTTHSSITLFFKQIWWIKTWLRASYLLLQSARNIFIFNLCSFELLNDGLLLSLELA